MLELLFSVVRNLIIFHKGLQVARVKSLKACSFSLFSLSLSFFCLLLWWNVSKVVIGVIIALYCKQVNSLVLRGAARFQIRWIFGKVPRGLWPPPPHFRKVILRISRQNCDKSAYVHMEELLCILWSYFPWDACSTNVQHGNRVKTYHKKTFLYHFHGQKALFKGPNFAI